MKRFGKLPSTLPNVLALATLFCVAPACCEAEDYDYVTNNSTITIVSYLGSGGAVMVPSAINGLPVTGIGAWAFSSLTNVTRVDLPNTVTDIGDHAFYSCTGLNTVTLPDSITNISSGGFMWCTALTALTIPTNVVSIGDSAFAQSTALTTLTIPASVRALGHGLFYGCTSLSAIIVAPENPFYASADGLLFNKDKTILREWPGGKAQSCAIPVGVTSIGDSAFYFCSTLTNVDLPDTVTNIGWTAFSGCDHLLGVTFPETLVSIDGYAFGYCSSLASVRIPASVSVIGDGAFNTCAELTRITVAESNAMYCSVDGVLFDKQKTALIQFPAARAGAYEIPSTVRRISESGFGGCYHLSSVTIPEGVEIIPSWAFDTCGALTAVTLPSSLTTIGYLAFRYCVNLTNLTIPSRVTEIQSGAFQACVNVTTAFFAGDAPEVQDYVFDADRLTVYYLPGRTGWSNTFAGRPAVLWNPAVQNTDAAFGPGPAGFGLPITGTADIPIVLEASAAFSVSEWVPLQSCTLTNGSIRLTDKEFANYPARFYRIRSP